MDNASLILDADNPAMVASGITPAGSTFVTARVSGPGDANQLLIFSGAALVNFESADESSQASQVVAVILHKNLPDNADFRGSTSYVALASLNLDETTEVVYAVVDAQTTVQSDGALRLNTEIAVEFSASILRLSYQVFVLIHSDR